MRPSTGVELAGFACLIVAAWWLAPIAGMFTAGASCLIVGYATEDDRTLLTLHRATDALKARRARRKARRAERKKK